MFRLGVAVVFAVEVAALAALPEVVGVAVRGVAVAMVDVDAVDVVERPPAARALLAGAVVVDALSVAVAMLGHQ